MMINNSIQVFIDATETFDEPQHDLARHVNNMHKWRDELRMDIQNKFIQPIGLLPESPLAQHISELNAQLLQQLESWDAKLDALKPAQSLANSFDDKVMLLIFGKFNAGKSSLCNVLADCFRKKQQMVQYFFLNAGEIIYSTEPLKEGATETTSRLQGVSLGKKLILLDTPGLHSVTPENAVLTQQFIDSADGVLWLSSSSSPGQVKELEALGYELHRHKPLLPVITRSDYFEEDEIDGEICQILCNKTSSQRSVQEVDVQTRASSKLTEMDINPALLHSPISISAQMLKQANLNDEAMESTGFNRLFEALFHLIQPASMYKQRKPAEILLHHLQEQVLKPLLTDGINQLNLLQLQLTEATTLLPLQKEKILTQTWRKIIPTLPALIEKFIAQQAVNELCTILIQQSELELFQQISLNLKEYQIQVFPLERLKLSKYKNYNLIYSIDNKNILSIDHEQLYNEILQKLLQLLSQYIDNIILYCQDSLIQIQEKISTIYQCFKFYEIDLQRIAKDIRGL